MSLREEVIFHIIGVLEHQENKSSTRSIRSFSAHPEGCEPTDENTILNSFNQRKDLSEHSEILSHTEIFIH